MDCNWTEAKWVEFANANGYTLDEARAAVAKCNARQDPPFWWSEIQRVLDNPLRKSHGSERFDISPDMCPNCGQTMRWIYWTNDTPPELECGCGGFVEICEPCKEWGRFCECWIS